MPLLVVTFRTFFFYILIAILYRIMGKREVGELGIIDLIVSISIAQLAAISIENHREPFYLALIPILILFSIQALFAIFSLKNEKFRRFFDGEPTVIIKNGKINFKAMVKERYNLEDLLTQLREKEIKSIDEVEHAILETNGLLSVFKYGMFKQKSYFPMPLILDGKLQIETLRSIRRNKSWLYELLNNKNLKIEDIFYAFYKNKKVYILKKDKLV